ncbi:MAG: CUAEP/CCAEP-tail radical SAM protein [Candidatus Acidiferrales bacterium]
MNVVLISTYELGHQPFGLASPAAWLAARGANVACMDLSREDFRENDVHSADLVALYVPMHTATRLAIALLPQIKDLNPRAHICFYGLYAPVNAGFMRRLGAQTILGGEFEAGLENLVDRLNNSSSEKMGFFSGSEKANLNPEGATSHSAIPISMGQAEPEISLARQRFLVPERGGLPPLVKYAHLILPDGGFRVAGYTEASRGCKHLCRHCPIVPVYDGAFRIVQREIVLEDIRRQVAAGAQHISFGDPDFFNGPTHGLGIVEEMHREFPQLSYDATIKIEHLLNHSEHLPKLRDTGCIFVTSAVESVDDAVLVKLAKGHTRADFIRAVQLFRETGLVLQPTFMPFTPWTTLDGYSDLLEVLAQQDLIENVAPIQLAIRLLIPAGSRMLDLLEIRSRVGAFDAAALMYPWVHSDPRVDALAENVSRIVEHDEKERRSREEIFAHIWEAAALAAGTLAGSSSPSVALLDFTQNGKTRASIPHMNEPWYCCAEPTREQLVSIGAPNSSLPSASPAAPTEHSMPQPDAFV